MRAVICRLFNLYSGEEKNALLFALLAFVWSIGSNLGYKYSDALLLINVGAQALPYIYVFSACGMVVPAVLLLYSINKVGSNTIFIACIAVAIVFYASVYFFINFRIGTDTGWLWYLLRIVSFQIDMILMTAYWTFIDQYHNMQDAKRLYVLFSLTVFCGQALTGFIMQAGLFEFKSVIYMIVMSFLMAIGLIIYITAKVHVAPDENMQEKEKPIGGGAGILKTIRSIWKSPFTVLMMANSFVIFLMWVTAEFSYLSYFDLHFDTPSHPYGLEVKTAAITVFLGKLLATVSVTNLIIGLFLYSRLIRRFGVASLLFLTPVMMIISMGGWLIHPALIFPVLAYFIVEGFLEVIDDCNFNLLLNAVPKNLKYRIRIFIESILEPFAMLTSGCILAIPYTNPVLLCLILSLIALAIAMIIRKNYHPAIYLNLASNAIHFHRTIKEWFSKMNKNDQESEKQRLLNILSTSEKTTDQIFALEGLFAFEDMSLINQLVKISAKLSADYKIQFLKMLGEHANLSSDLTNRQVGRWLKMENDDEVYAAVEYYLARQGLLDPKHVSTGLQSSNLTRRSAAIITLKNAWEKIPANTLLENRKTADKNIEMMLRSSNTDDIIAALNILAEEASHPHYSLLLSFLDHPSDRVKRAAMSSFAKIANHQCRQYAKILIYHLRRSNDYIFRKSTLIALSKLEDSTLIRDIIAASTHFRQSERRLIKSIVRKIGVRAVPILLTLLKDTSMPDRCRALAGRILGNLALSHLHSNIHAIINVEIERAYFYYYYANSIQKQYPNEDLTILIEALQTGFHSVIDFIIQILSTAGEVEDCELISRLFRSDDLKLRSQVVETLEKTCDRKIFKRLRPLLENVPAEEILQDYLGRKNKVLTLNELLIHLSRSSSQVDRIVSLTLMKKLNLPDWKDFLVKLLSSNEEIFRHYASELIEL
jgi:ATP/ADP translocase/HEAT repeat protein